jgi:hypothetical protein
MSKSASEVQIVPEPTNGVRAKLEITLLVNNQLQVNGPLPDKLLCLGMLALAEGVVREYDAARTPGILVPRILGRS